MKRALLIHDIYNEHQKGWYETIRHNLEFLGFKVITPNFPFPDVCNYESWMRVLIREFNENKIATNKIEFKFDVIISHGVGAYFAIGALSRGDLASPVNYFIAPYYPHKQNNKTFEDIGILFDEQFDKKIKSEIFNENNTFVFYSDDDAYVSLLAFQKLQQYLNATWYLIKKGKHFLVGDTDDIPELRIILEKYIRELLESKTEKISKIKSDFLGISNEETQNPNQSKNKNIDLPKKYKIPKDSFFTLKTDVSNVLDTESSIELSNFMKKEKRRDDYHKKQIIFLLEKVTLSVLIGLLLLGVFYVSYFIKKECCEEVRAPSKVFNSPVTVIAVSENDLINFLNDKGDDRSRYVPYETLKNIPEDSLVNYIGNLRSYVDINSGIFIRVTQDYEEILLPIVSPVSANIIAKEFLVLVGETYNNKSFTKKNIRKNGNVRETYYSSVTDSVVNNNIVESKVTGGIEIIELKKPITIQKIILEIEFININELKLIIPRDISERLRIGVNK